MLKQSILNPDQEKAIQDFFAFNSAAGYCESLDDIFNYSLQVERQGTANEFTILRQIKQLITAIDPAKP